MAEKIASRSLEHRATLGLHSIAVGIIELLGVAIVYFISAKAGLALASVHPNATPIWPPTGIALAAVMLRGYRVCPAIFLAAFLVNATTAGSVFTSFAIAAGNTLESAVGGYLIRRWSGGLGTFDTAGNLTRFSLVSLVCATPISAAIGVASLTIAGYASPASFAHIWLTWWLGDCAGALVITPVVVLWAIHRGGFSTRRELLEAGSAFLTASAVGLIAFTPLVEQSVSGSPLGFLAVLPLTWAALRRGQRDTATVAFILSFFAVWGSVLGGGPFGWSTELNDSFLLLVMFMISTAVPSLALSADVALRKRTEEDLRQAYARMDQTIQERSAALAKTRQDLFQIQKIEAVGQLTSGIAHDFNNLLTTILGSLELVTRYVSGARAARLLTAASQAAQHGANLTAQLLAFSRKQDIALRPVDVNGVIRGMQDMIDHTAGPLARISYDLDHDAWPAMANADQLRVSLLNLAANARDAMPLGGQLVFKTRHLAGGRPDINTPDLQPSDYMEVTVSDSGSGMTEDIRSRAFEPFFTTKGPGKGVGLGLAMVYGFAKQSGGTVAIESTPGRGTTVSIFLPRTDGDLVTEDRAEPRAATPIGRVRILLIDDDESVRKLTRELLEELGHDVSDASSGPAALEIMQGNALFDLLLVDFAMPAMNGSEFAAAAKKIRPEIPILFMSGYVDSGVLRHWSDIGYQILNKPFKSADLAAAICAAFAASPPRLSPDVSMPAQAHISWTDA
jgi:signal transduction histidine kinase/ActR/RegA family two-component response regulator